MSDLDTFFLQILVFSTENVDFPICYLLPKYLSRGDFLEYADPLRPVGIRNLGPARSQVWVVVTPRHADANSRRRR
jgi:hypothetical protein